MSQSVTVLSGVANSTIGGLVTVPLDVQASIAGPLQTLLSNVSNSVVSGGYFLDNVNAVTSVNGFYTVSANTTTLPGILEFTNTDANGSVVSGSSNVYVISPSEPPNYNILIDQVPGTFQIRGNGSANQLAIFAKGATGSFNTQGGSGTIIAGGGGDLFATNGNWTVDGSTDGGDTVNANGSSVLVNTYGVGSAGGGNAVIPTAGTPPSNTVGVLGGSATVNAGGTADLVEAYNGSNVVVSVTGSAAILAGGGNVTVDAAAGSSNVKAFFQIGGSLYFVNQSTVQAFVTGDAPGATGGNATVFGGTGGGVYFGGNGGANSLIGGFAPGQASTAGGAGLVTLVGGGSSNNFIEATGSLVGGGNTQNLLIAGGTGSVIGGTATLVGTGTTSVNTFQAGNASSLVVSTSGAGLQTFNLINNSGNETITGSTAATASNLFLVNDPASAGANIYITNFSTAPGAHDTVSMQGGITVAGVTSVTAGAYAGKLEFQLSDGTNIVLTNTSYSSAYNSFVGKSTI